MLIRTQVGILYGVALRHLHKALLPGQVYTFIRTLSEWKVGIDTYIAEKFSTAPEKLIKEVFTFDETEEGINYWQEMSNRWQLYVEEHKAEMEDKVRRVLGQI